ncbi:hypothetical protein LTS17_002569 [Exophiala oligosperma]
MADENRLGPQPDFNLIAEEFRKAQNLPAVNNGQQILAELRVIHREIADTRRDIADTRRDLTTMMTASNHNNTARVQNTYVKNQSEPLSPFVNPSTGAAIPEFPATSVALRQMSGRQTETVLQRLGLQPAPGATVAAKKKMLRAHIGLTEVAGQPPA